jgi:hypothetical protein
MNLGEAPGEVTPRDSKWTIRVVFGRPLLRTGALRELPSMLRNVTQLNARKNATAPNHRLRPHNTDGTRLAP